MSADLPEDLLARYPGAVGFRFGDSAQLSARLLGLVRAGRKIATCGAVRDYRDAEPLPVTGRRDIVLDWEMRPALVIETQAVVFCRFDEVTEDMALAEGEDDDLAGWRAGHQAYFARNGGFAPDMHLVWERFRLIEDLAR